MSPAASRPGRLVACPGCGKPVAYSPENPWRPFCCERCRQQDLGAWASEAYRIPLRAEDGMDADTVEDEAGEPMPPRS